MAKKIKIFFLAILAFQFIYIIILKWIFPLLTITQLISVFQGYGLHRHAVSMQNISPNARLAVIASEDQLFAEHDGFDWNSIKKAIAHNQRKPTKIRGASTISQQVAKNVFLWQGRSWIRKGLELYFTFMIETFWGKKRILEMYLNVVEMGKGVFGIEAASMHYFKKSAKKLTRTEAAQIAAILPNPKKLQIKPLSNYVRKRAHWVQLQMRHIETDFRIAILLE